MNNDSDEEFTLWLFAWDVHAFTHDPLHIFDANIMAPLPNTLGYEENGIGSAVIAAPVLWTTGNLLLSMNTVLLLSIPLSGVGVYLLARKLKLSEPASFLAGLLFAIEPPRFFRIDQFHVTTIQWWPFCLAYLHAYLDDGRRRDLWLALAFFSAQAITSGHGTAFLLVTILLLLAYRLLFGEPIAPVRRLRDFGVVGAVLLLPAVLVYIPYQRARTEAGLVRMLQGHATTPATYLGTPSKIDNALLRFYPDWAREPPGAYLFPGYLPLLFVIAAPLVPRKRTATAAKPPASVRWLRWAARLAEVVALVYGAAALWVTWTGTRRVMVFDTPLITVRQPWRLWLTAAAAIAIRVALSRRAPFDGSGRLRRAASWTRTIPERWPALRRNSALFYVIVVLVSVSILPGPEYGLWPHVYWIPPLSFIRAPLRFSLLAVLGLSVLAGYAFDRYASWLSRRSAWTLAVALSALFAIEFSAIPLGTIEQTVVIPDADRWLATQPRPFTIAEVPIHGELTDSSFANKYNARYMLHSTAHFQKTVMGYTGVLPDEYAELHAQLASFPSDESLRHLLALNVRYVVVHDEYFPADEHAALEQRLPRFASWLTLEHSSPDARVYSIHPPQP
ncbi:MAG TPA: hypothetical protein VEU08_16990 [Vicinamibacterales bacterium]|nr:hypothetical protein [Vicinamibacterales bacterium]